MAKFTREDVPVFMYLLSEIKGTEHYKASNNFAKDIEEKGSVEGCFEVSDTNARRVFRLYDNLKAGEVIERNYTRPNRNTLNVFTTYLFYKKGLETKPVYFSAFKKHNKSDINAYYLNNKPSDFILNEIFKKLPSKINHLQNQEDTLYAMLNELNGISLENFVKFWVDESLRENKKEKDLSKIKSELKNYIDNRINSIEKKKRRASFISRFFGSLSLFFISIDYREISKENVLDDFLNNYDALVDEDVLDDLI